MKNTIIVTIHEIHEGKRLIVLFTPYRCPLSGYDNDTVSTAMLLCLSAMVGCILELIVTGIL